MAAAIVPAGGTVQGARVDTHMFSTSDDDAKLKQIQATHAPDGLEVDVIPFIHVIEDIMQCSTPSIPGLPPGSAQLDALEHKTLQNCADSINRISCEIACKCSGGSDAHTTTLAVFKTLSSYSWEAKVVITFAAFAVNYGEFRLVAQRSNPLAKSVALLKQLPGIELADSLALINLIKAMLDVTKCIVQFKDFSSQYITPDTKEITTAVYWTIQSIVACANLISMGHKYIASTTEASNLSSLAHKVNNIHKHLQQKQFALCYIDGNGYIEAFRKLVCLFEMAQIDNMNILKALIYAKDDLLPLFDGSNKKRVSIDVLRRKNVLLLISNLDLSPEEHSILNQMCQSLQSQKNQHEVVWLPVLDSTIPGDDAKQKKFEELQSSKHWFSLYNPSLLDPAVIKYIKEVWHFNEKPLLVVLDHRGKVVNPNAIHMLWIWRDMAFPYSRLKEEELWKGTKLSIKLLANSMDQSIVDWIEDKKYVCLYGGEDLEWIKKFTKKAQTVAKAANITLGMWYVGKSNPREKDLTISNNIKHEDLSYILSNPTLFWVRLESMWQSKMQHSTSVGNDTIMRDIITILTFHGSEQGWAVISHDDTVEMAKAKGDNMVNSLTKYEDWKDRANKIGFVTALIGNLEGLRTPHHCNRLMLPGTTGSIPEKVVCVDCGCLMEKFIMYRCCTE